MTISEFTQLITALGALGALVVSWRNGRKIYEIHLATNSLKDELVAEVREASIAAGRKQVHEEQRKAKDRLTPPR